MGDQELCTHAMVSQVTIDRVDGQRVSFWTRSASKTGDPNERLRRLFTVPLADVWTAAIPGAPAPVALAPGATGALYLSKAGWDTASADGFQIFGAGTDAVAFKFPSCLAPGPFQGDLMVIPSSLIVQGYVEGQAELFQIDLLGPAAADAQDVMWNGAEHVEIRLRADGASGHGAGGDPAWRTLRVWPTQIVVAGCAASAPLTAGEVDLLDNELAGPAQHLALGGTGKPISLVLTQDGFGAFHVVPGM